MDEHDLRRMNEALAFVGGLLTIALTLRVLLGPDALAQLKMRGYRVISRTAKNGAETLSIVAASADTAYHRLSNVTA